MADTLVGTATLARAWLRRDRWLLPAWVLGFAIVAGSSAKATVDLYPDIASRVEAAKVINASAALVALYGRIYDPGSLGAVALIKLTAFGSALIAVLMLFIVIRHTRAEEEDGRLELVGGGSLGRAAPLTAGLLVAYGAGLALGLITAGLLVYAGLDAAGSLAFGFGWAFTGMAFASVGAVVAQLTTSARTARGLGLVVIAVTYAFRALGDLSEPGPSWLSWLSPIGWNQQVRAFAGDRWPVLLLPLALCTMLVPTAYALRARRDLGAGFIGERPGRAEGSLATTWDLAVRLHGRTLLGWALGYTLGGVLFGSVARSIPDLLGSPNARRFFQALGGGQVLVDTFVGAMLGILGAIAAAYGVSTAARLRGEEVTGHAEALLATATTRTRWAAGHYVIAMAGIAVLMTLGGTTMAIGVSMSLHDSSQFPRVLAVALAQIPAAWVLTGLVMALFGWAPRATAAAWGALVVFITLGEFGELWNAPRWLMDLSPFQHTPHLPVAAGWVLPLALLAVVAAGLAAAGFAGWRVRDSVV